MSSADLLADGFNRIQEAVHGAVDGLTAAQLSFRVDGAANSIAWLVWHLTRVEDDHIADAARTDQLWTTTGWAERFDLPLDRSDTGFGHDTADVESVRVDSGDLLTGYHDAVTAATLDYVRRLSDDDLAQVIDESWDPPVTLGVRLVSVVGDGLQHAGQAGFVRGIVERRRP